MALTDKLKNIADAIRTKTNTIESMTLDDMPSKIENISTAEDLTEEITTYNNELSEQEEQLTNIMEVLKLKASTKIPEVGFLINEWDATGYPTSITFHNMNFLNTGLFKISSSAPSILTRVAEIKFNQKLLEELPDECFSGLTSLKTISGIKNIAIIRANAFYNCTQLELTELPTNLISLGQSAFTNCRKIAIKTLPSGISQLNGYVFSGCTSITQMSMSNVAAITSVTANASAFAKCTNLKAIWIGSTITNSGLNNYAFSTCTSLKKMFIDLQRATVEAFTSYSAYSNLIVCNDDADFMTQEEFDAIDWATYSE